jgi:hypothetical protein
MGRILTDMKLLDFVVAGVIVGFLLGSALGSWFYAEDPRTAGFFASLAEVFSSSEGAYRGHYGWIGAILSALVDGWAGYGTDSGKPNE